MIYYMISNDNIAIALESSRRSIIINKIDKDGNPQEITLTAK